MVGALIQLVKGHSHLKITLECITVVYMVYLVLINKDGHWLLFKTNIYSVGRLIFHLQNTNSIEYKDE